MMVHKHNQYQYILSFESDPPKSVGLNQWFCFLVAASAVDVDFIWISATALRRLILEPLF